MSEVICTQCNNKEWKVEREEYTEEGVKYIHLFLICPKCKYRLGLRSEVK